MFLFFGLCGAATSPTMYIVFIFFAGATNMVNYTAAFVLGKLNVVYRPRSENEIEC